MKVAMDLWKKVERPGIERLIEFLEKSDYLTAPCSRNNHLAVRGGLVRHSVNVWTVLYEKVKLFKLQDISEETMIICGLGHDVCKIDTYAVDDRPPTDKQIYKLRSLISPAAYERYESQQLSLGWVSKLIDHHLKHPFGDGTVPPQKDSSYKIEEKFPLGHGDKSVFILSKYIDLTEVEALAIRWHMGPWDQGYGKSFNDAQDFHPLVTLLHTADLEASRILEKEDKE